ncbi:hypothetical protein [Micromonospora sp. NPDC005413]|uniref:hypothetical protein n=1 Tax=Micromonospora sp. NPDC005413 TaxID=3154563 RepID=UPI0033BB6F77
MSAQAAALSAGAAATRMLAAIDPAAAVIVSTYPLASQVLGRLRPCGRITAGSGFESLAAHQRSRA